MNASGDGPPADGYRVVFQVARAGADFHAAVLRNVANVLDALPGCEVRVVAHGEGIVLVTGTVPDSGALGELSQKGVRFFACTNTLTRKNIPSTSVLPGVDLVTAGVAELVRLQHAGWSYIHP